MKPSTDYPWYASSALQRTDYVICAIERLGDSLACEVAREENRDIVSEDDIDKGIERAVAEIYEEIRNPTNSGKNLLDLINSLANRHAA